MLDYKHTASSYDYIGMVNVIELSCVVMLLLGLLCLYQIYLARYNANRPFTTVYLQLTTSTSQVYIPFLELRHAIQHYLFSAAETVTGHCDRQISASPENRLARTHYHSHSFGSHSYMVTHVGLDL